MDRGLPTHWELWSSRRPGLRNALLSAGLLALLGIMQVVHRLALAMDHVLFPRFRQQAIRAPLFIVGPPRNGTTLLHRLLASQSQTFTTLQLWELLFAPAICEKYFLLGIDRVDALFGRPLRRILLACQQALLQRSDDVHATSLLAPEEDYLALSYYQACFLLVIPFPFCRSVWQLGRFDECIDPLTQTRITRSYRRLLQRHLFVFGQHRAVLSKNPAFCSWIVALQREFPDARFVAPLRHPVEAVASQLSSVRSAMQRMGNDVTDPMIVHAFVDLLAYYYTHVTGHLVAMPANRACLLSYRALTSCPQTPLIALLERLGYDTAGELDTWTTEVTNARRFRSRHRYALQDYHLSAADVVARLPINVLNLIEQQSTIQLALKPSPPSATERMSATEWEPPTLPYPPDPSAATPTTRSMGRQPTARAGMDQPSRVTR